MYHLSFGRCIASTVHIVHSNEKEFKKHVIGWMNSPPALSISKTYLKWLPIRTQCQLLQNFKNYMNISKFSASLGSQNLYIISLSVCIVESISCIAARLRIGTLFYGRLKIDAILKSLKELFRIF
jgi:hypothetical protein